MVKYYLDKFSYIVQKFASFQDESKGCNELLAPVYQKPRFWFYGNLTWTQLPFGSICRQLSDMTYIIYGMILGSVAEWDFRDSGNIQLADTQLLVSSFCCVCLFVSVWGPVQGNKTGKIFEVIKKPSFASVLPKIKCPMGP